MKTLVHAPQLADLRRQLEARDRKIFELWLACWTEREIAAETGASEGDVHAVCSKTAELPNLSKTDRAAAEHATDFDLPIYNIWRSLL